MTRTDRIHKVKRFLGLSSFLTLVSAPHLPIPLSPHQSVWAAPADLESVLSAMRKAEKDMRSVSFEFKQTANIQATGDRQEIRGRAFFKKPNKFRVEHLSPRSQTVVSDGEKLWMYNPAQKQVLVDRWENWSRSAGLPEGLAPFQSGVDDLRKKYDIRLATGAASASGDAAVLHLTPREAGPWPYRLTFWVDRKNGWPRRTELKSQSVESMTEVSQMKMNPDLSDELFRFKTPAGVQEVGAPRPPAGAR